MKRNVCKGKLVSVVFVTAAIAAAQPVVRNPSFETPGLDGCPRFQYKPHSAPWEFVGDYTGITALGCNIHFVSPPPPPGAGAQAAFLQSLGETEVIRQTLGGFVPGRAYTITFYAAGRRSNPADCNRGCGKLNFSVFAGSVKVLDVEPSTQVFEQYTTRSFSAPQPNLTITFSGAASPGTDQTAFIDLVSVSPVPGSAELLSAPVTLSSLPSPGPVQPPPPHLRECESPERCDCGSPDRCDGFWSFSGTIGSAVWQSGTRAKLAVVSFDSRNIVIQRSDSEGSSPGLTAVYRGVLTGKKFEGDVTWTWPGHWAGPGHGHWSAIIDDSPATPAADIPVFSRDAGFVYDLNGEWRLTFPPESPRKPPITLVARQDPDGSVQFISGNPNIFWPFGQCVINALYKGDRIEGDEILTPAHKGDGFGGWAWGPVAIKVVDANHLLLPGNIVMTRTTRQPGGNIICDPVTDAHSGRAGDQLQYAHRNYDLGNFANAACWYYVSARQGNDEAQLALGLILYRGEGLAKNKVQSYSWFRRAAEQGNPDAARAVAHCYEVGIGVPVDKALAKVWNDRAETQLAQNRQADAARSQSRANVAAWSLLLGGGNSSFDDAVEQNQSRGMSRSSAVDAARNSQAQSSFWNSLTHFEPPAPPRLKPSSPQK